MPITLKNLKNLAFAILCFTYHSASASLEPCGIVFDGRIPLSYRPATFDTNSSVFDDQFVHGESEPFIVPLHRSSIVEMIP